MTELAITQVDGGEWPSGDSLAIAMLPFEPDEITQRISITFSGQRDDLGHYRAAAIATSGGRMLLFVRYLDAPSNGVTVFVDASDSLADALAELLQLLGLKRDALPWINQDAEREYRLRFVREG